MAILRVSVTTNACSETEAYIHDLPVETNKVLIIDAVETLYGAEGVSRIEIELVEE